MAKSVPDSAIFMDDGADEVRRKVRAAFCPPRACEGNPCLEYAAHLVLPWFGAFEATTSGGARATYADAAALERAYVCGEIGPAELKEALAEQLNRALEPVRRHFETDARAAALLEQVRGFRVTR
jgi:tyrosyl-tRNA synthetase